MPDLPDTAGIALSSSKDLTTARVGSTLFIDDLAYTGWVGINESDLCSDKVQLFPNPAKDNLNIRAQIEDADNVQVADVSGKAVGVYKIQNYNANVNTSVFVNGFYLYDIRDKKDRILAKGKFSVSK